MTWSNIKDLADSFMEKKGLKDKTQESLLLIQANQLLLDFFGQKSKDKIRALYFKEGILTIVILSDNLYHKIEQEKNEFISRLNKLQQKEIISTLRFLK